MPNPDFLESRDLSWGGIRRYVNFTWAIFLTGLHRPALKECFYCLDSLCHWSGFDSRNTTVLKSKLYELFANHYLNTISGEKRRSKAKESFWKVKTRDFKSQKIFLNLTPVPSSITYMYILLAASFILFFIEDSYTYVLYVNECSLLLNSPFERPFLWLNNYILYSKWFITFKGSVSQDFVGPFLACIDRSRFV